MAWLSKAPRSVLPRRFSQTKGVGVGTDVAVGVDKGVGVDVGRGVVVGLGKGVGVNVAVTSPAAKTVESSASVRPQPANSATLNSKASKKAIRNLTVFLSPIIINE